jgi:hypothetical protein
MPRTLNLRSTPPRARSHSPPSGFVQQIGGAQPPTRLVVDYDRQPDIFRRFGAALSVGGASPRTLGEFSLSKPKQSWESCW